NALARQPGRPPLRESAPSPLGPPEVQDRGSEPAGGEKHGDRQCGKAEARAWRQQAERRAEPEQQQERETSPRRSREKNDRQRRMHGRPWDLYRSGAGQISAIR